jgi:hypothetical protein
MSRRVLLVFGVDPAEENKSKQPTLQTEVFVSHDGAYRRHDVAKVQQQNVWFCKIREGNCETWHSERGVDFGHHEECVKVTSKKKVPVFSP